VAQDGDTDCLATELADERHPSSMLVISLDSLRAVVVYESTRFAAFVSDRLIALRLLQPPHGTS